MIGLNLKLKLLSVSDSIFLSLFPGEVVYVIGHAVFGADLDLLPTVTMGIVSKINRIAGTPVMIQVLSA